MEYKRYGHAGRPMLYIPCQDGHFYDFENFHMDSVLAPWIESGQLMVFSIDTLDSETWSNSGGDPRWRIDRHEAWMRYITDEMVPFMRSEANDKNGWTGNPDCLVFGCSLGALHAVNCFYRRPDLFDGLLALSGIYTASYGFGNYMDELVYLNSPIDYIANMPADHPYIDLYNQKRSVICVGQGAWEMPDSTRQLGNALASKNIHTWVDFWGYDCVHDWDWWYKQAAYFMPYLLGQ